MNTSLHREHETARIHPRVSSVAIEEARSLSVASHCDLKPISGMDGGLVLATRRRRWESEEGGGNNLQAEKQGIPVKYFIHLDSPSVSEQPGGHKLQVIPQGKHIS